MPKLPEGKYIARAVEGGLGYAQTGTERIAIEFELLTDPEGKPVGVNNRITWYGWLTENAFPFTMQALAALGWLGSDLSELNGSIRASCPTEVELVIGDEEFEGKRHSRVQYVNPIGGRGDRGAARDRIEDKAEARKFSDKYAARIRDWKRTNVPF